jgi:hypothetical protein
MVLLFCGIDKPRAAFQGCRHHIENEVNIVSAQEGSCHA